MDIGKAKITNILEAVSDALSSHPSLEDVPIYWDEAELDPNRVQFPCIQLQPLAWEKGKGCDFEREFQIRVINKTESRRDALLQLYDFEENIRNVIDEKICYDPNCSWFELSLIGGSQIAIMSYITKDPDSYKSAKTNFGSIVGIRYNLRY